MTSTPVVMVHGWGGSFASTWQEPGLAALFEEAGRPVIGVDLLGHGTNAKPHDMAAYEDLTVAVRAVLPDEPVDAIGFSLGARTLLRLACDEPDRFARLVIAGVGDDLFRPMEGGTIADVVEHGAGPDADARARMFAGYARDLGNDPVALAACLRVGRAAFDAIQLGKVTCPVLVALGEADWAAPADRLVASLPDARLVMLKRTDHFATPNSFAFFDAALEFLGAAPA